MGDRHAYCTARSVLRAGADLPVNGPVETSRSDNNVAKGFKPDIHVDFSLWRAAAAPALI
jgi:hypothetical protein